MADNRLSLSCGGRDTVYIDTNRILDSCRDKDCFEDVTVYLTDAGREAIERGGNVRTKDAHVICAQMTVDPVPFNRGFYQVTIRMYVKVDCEVCTGMGRSQDVEGLCTVEKKVVLYGSEGNVSIFKSSSENNSFCSNTCESAASSNLPTAVLEVVDPIVLNTKIVDACRFGDGMRRPDCFCEGTLPESVAEFFGGRLCADPAGRNLTVSLGFFSVVRIERPAQYLVNGTEYTVPEKECVTPNTDDPCSMFRRMAFPTSEFYPPALDEMTTDQNQNQGGCGCGRR
ncbi:MAG: hypothetical protein IJR55_03320 [Clostridia bacterium]|nr:hypothetical protein [Clostridia bacterium]